MRDIRNLRVPVNLLLKRLQSHDVASWDSSAWILDPAGGRIPTAARLQIVRERVMAHARRGPSETPDGSEALTASDPV
ncbi:MAG: hypothetical protein HUU25_09990 [Candidatus Sumerlaeia bacterium]|nr:hypothetical protein [Candidatus Sumerlaeia bacterium]